MDLYIDKNNLVSFLRAGKNTNVDDRDVYEECQRLIRRNMHLIFNFEKRSCEKDEDLLPWLLSKVSAGRGKSENVDEFRTQKFPERPLKTNFRTNKDWKLFTSVFMTRSHFFVNYFVLDLLIFIQFITSGINKHFQDGKNYLQTDISCHVAI